MAKLKPCPFCGYDMSLIYSDPLWDGCPPCYVSYKIVCANCSATIKRSTEEKAIEAWNRRANDG